MWLYSVEGHSVLLSYDESEWFSVFAPTRSRTQPIEYDRFGYNIRERRWSHSVSPRNSTLVKEIIHSLRRTDRHTDQASAAEGRKGGCLFIVAVAVALAILYLVLQAVLAAS
jgi:hypothetical protein